MAIDEDVESSQACPSMSYLFPGNTNYAKDIRSPLANFVPTRTKTSNLVRKLHASDFQSNNDDHLNLVKNMGINIISLPDGRVQLLHTLSNVCKFTKCLLTDRLGGKEAWRPTHFS